MDFVAHEYITIRNAVIQSGYNFTITKPFPNTVVNKTKCPVKRPYLQNKMSRKMPIMHRRNLERGRKVLCQMVSWDIIYADEP
jgi:hypothetical protein